MMQRARQYAQAIVSASILLLAAGVLIADEKPAKTEKAETPAAKSKEVTVEHLKLTVPTSWKQETPKSKLRKAQFRIPGAKGHEGAELAIFSFGGGGGGVAANVQRWISQFQTKDRKVKVTRGKSAQGPYIFVDISGTYNQPIGPPIQRKTKPLANARMLSVILGVEAKRAVYYIKLAGEKETIDAAYEAIRKSFGADAKSETEVKFGE